MSCYIVLNNDGRIHTISEKDDNILQYGQIRETSEISMSAFVETLPDLPNNCVKVDGEYISSPIIPTVTYSGDILISWALQQEYAASIMVHMAAFLDFANKVTESSKSNFIAYATAVGVAEIATTIINKAIELGANLSEVE